MPMRVAQPKPPSSFGDRSPRRLPDESHVRKAYALLCSCEEKQGNLDQALAECCDGLKLFPLDAELRFRRGLILQSIGRFREAAETYEDLLRRGDQRHFTSVSDGLDGHLTRHNLAIVYEEMGNWSEAESQWRQILNEHPAYEPARRTVRLTPVPRTKL